MNGEFVTTPFGRRGMSFGNLATQMMARTIRHDESVDKWKLFRLVCEAKPLLGISDRSLSVLNALLSFYPKAELNQENGLVVFPSNRQLSLRAHGITEQTLRRHLAALVDAGLITRKDSPNGKRYARKSRAGEITDAYGFSLAPLLARANDIDNLASQITEDRLYLQRLRERISLCRRDITKLIEIGMSEAVPGAWESYQARYMTINSATGRNPKAPRLTLILEEFENLRQDITNDLENNVKIQKTSGNAGQNERLIQSSESESILDTTANSERADAMEREQPVLSNETTNKNRSSGSIEENEQKTKRTFDLQTVLKACPEISMYGPGGAIRNWQQLQNAATVVRDMLRISPSAYGDAERAMGTQSVITVIACILERAADINSAGGYLRSLTLKSINGKFNVAPMLMTLLKSRSKSPVKG
jgi:replication initiation protein RepC